MKRLRETCGCLLALALTALSTNCSRADEGQWVSLFDGTTLSGWTKAGSDDGNWEVKDGSIVGSGKSLMLYSPKKYKNFRFRTELKINDGGNSGVNFRCPEADGDFGKGYEAQVDNTHSDPKRTGSLYGVKDYLEVPAKDNEWWTYHITYNNGKITTSVDGKLLVEYTEPDDPGANHPKSGTFCLQGHDPKSKVLFRNIRVKPLPD